MPVFSSAEENGFDTILNQPTEMHCCNNNTSLECTKKCTTDCKDVCITLVRKSTNLNNTTYRKFKNLLIYKILAVSLDVFDINHQ